MPGERKRPDNVIRFAACCQELIHSAGSTGGAHAATDQKQCRSDRFIEVEIDIRETNLVRHFRNLLWFEGSVDLLPSGDIDHRVNQYVSTLL